MSGEGVEAAMRYGYSINEIDDDEIAWAVEMMKAGGTAWGRDSTIIAEGTEFDHATAVERIKAAAAELGIDRSKLVRLPM